MPSEKHEIPGDNTAILEGRRDELMGVVADFLPQVVGVVIEVITRGSYRR
jgi:hypothetical protein